MGQFLNIKEFTNSWKIQLSEKRKQVRGVPLLKIIQLGDNAASTKYVQNKIKDCKELGIMVYHCQLPIDATDNDILKELVTWTEFVIIQLPLPEQIHLDLIKQFIKPEQDIDGILGDASKFKPCTPYGIMKYLEYCNFELDGADVTVIGRSNLVGKPMASMLVEANATVTLCHSHTKNLEDKIKNADLIVCAVGKPHFFNADDFGVPVIDVGINFENGKMIGDVDGNCKTPVPGGVGLLTRCALLDQIVAWKQVDASIKF